jgi:hypothetical protein
MASSGTSTEARDEDTNLVQASRLFRRCLTT